MSASTATAPFAALPDGRVYMLTRDVAWHDGILLAAVLTDGDGTDHLAVCAEETSDTLSYLIAQLAPGQADLVRLEAALLRRLLLESPRTARLRLVFAADGSAAQATETLVPAGDLTDDELPLA